MKLKERYVSMASWHMFPTCGYRPYSRIRWGYCCPRVHGGYVIMCKDIIVTANLDEITVYRAIRHNKHKRVRYAL